MTCLKAAAAIADAVKRCLPSSVTGVERGNRRMGDRKSAVRTGDNERDQRYVCSA